MNNSAKIKFISGIILVVLLFGGGLIGDRIKIKYHANQIIRLADQDLGLIKQYPAYKVPDLSRLHQNINKDWIRQLWSNFFNPKSLWTTWDGIYNHGRYVMGFSHEQMIEIGKALGFLEDEEEGEEPPRLVVKNRQFYYGNGGTEPIVLIGAFPRQLLHVIKDYAGEMERSPDWFIAKAKSSGINKIRLNVVDDYDLTYDFAKDMEEHNIIVEYTMAKVVSTYFGDYKEHIQRLKPLNNIIIEVWNEFYRTNFIQADIDKALEIANYALSEGMIVSGGAWGNSASGKAMSEAFQKEFKGQVWTIHRRYPPRHLLEADVDEALDAGFAVSWNEVLMKPWPTGIEPHELEAYTRCLADKKASVMLYVRCEEFFDLMGNLAKEYNQ